MYKYILFKKFSSNSKRGFTLAEVLITLLVIGVVASMVIPALIQDSQNAETVTQVKKYQSILSQATMNIRNDYGSILNSPLNSYIANEWSGDHAAGWNEFKKQLNLVKDCDTTGKDCWANVMYKHLNGTDWVNFNNYAIVGRGILSDGSLIDYEAKSNCSLNRSSTNSGPLYNSNCALIIIDVNGYKPPNQGGRDVFVWYIMKDGTVYPVGSLDDVNRGCDPSSLSSTGKGIGCTAKIIKEGKIDY